MLADPQTVTLDGVTKTLPRVASSQPSRLGVFETSDGLLNLTTRQDKSKNRFRREVRLTSKKISPDPISAVNKEVSASIIIVIDEPNYGFSDAELTDLYNALTGHADGVVDEMLGGQL